MLKEFYVGLPLGYYIQYKLDTRNAAVILLFIVLNKLRIVLTNECGDQ